jgi:hypothetical protein
MPRVQIHVRAKDFNIWQGIEDKPLWLTTNLNRHKRSMKRNAKKKQTTEIDRVRRPKHPNLLKANEMRTEEDKTEHLCKHYCYKGLCPVKDCINYMGEEITMVQNT